MNQSDKNRLNTVDQVIDDIISEMPLDDWVKTANLDEDGLLILQLGLGKYLRYLIDNQSKDVNKKLLKDCIKQSGNETLDEAEAASYILKELWDRLRKTHRLRAVKWLKLRTITDINILFEFSYKLCHWWIIIQFLGSTLNQKGIHMDGS